MMLRRPEIVGTVPQQMFVDLQQTLTTPVDSSSQRTLIHWSPEEICGLGVAKETVEALQPLLDIILEQEVKIQSVEFDISNGWVMPGKAQRMLSANKMHRDIGTFDRAVNYITANCLFTDFGRRFAEPPGGSVARFRQQKHRSPTNTSQDPVLRTWIRGRVNR